MDIYQERLYPRIGAPTMAGLRLERQKDAERAKAALQAEQWREWTERTTRDRPHQFNEREEAYQDMAFRSGNALALRRLAQRQADKIPHIKWEDIMEQGEGLKQHAARTRIPLGNTSSLLDQIRDSMRFESPQERTVLARAPALAFLTGYMGRLGVDSPVRDLPGDVTARIMGHLRTAVPSILEHSKLLMRDNDAELAELQLQLELAKRAETAAIERIDERNILTINLPPRDVEEYDRHNGGTIDLGPLIDAKIQAQSRLNAKREAIAEERIAYRQAQTDAATLFQTGGYSMIPPAQ